MRFQNLFAQLIVVFAFVTTTAFAAVERAEESRVSASDEAFVFVENSFEAERFTLDLRTKSEWSYELDLGHMSEYLSNLGILAGNPHEGINSLGFTAAFGDWSFGAWLGQSEDNPGMDESYNNEVDLLANWDHGFEKFSLSVGFSYFDLAVPRLFSSRGDLVVLEFEISWPRGDLTPYFRVSKYLELGGSAGNGEVFRAGLRGHWGGDDIWLDVDLSLARNDGSVQVGTYLWAEVTPSFRLGKHSSLGFPVQGIWGDHDDHIAVGVSLSYEF